MNALASALISLMRCDSPPLPEDGEVKPGVPPVLLSSSGLPLPLFWFPKGNDTPPDEGPKVLDCGPKEACVGAAVGVRVARILRSRDCENGSGVLGATEIS